MYIFTFSIDLNLNNGASITGEIVIYVVKPFIPFAGLAAVGLAGLLGRKLRRK